MSTIITVEKAKVIRCDFIVRAIKNNSEIRADEVTGCPGSAAAKALNMKAHYSAQRIVGPKEVLELV